jgi:dihydroflavonol-4-reductase
MKIFLTGPDGVLGNNLVRLLLEKEYEVKVFIQTGNKAVYLENLPIEREYGNILVPEEVNKAVSGCDIIIHAAAKTDSWPTRDKSYWDVNVDGTRNIIRAARANGIKKLIHIGTANSFGAGNKLDPGNEERPFAGYKYKLDYISSKYAIQEEILSEVKNNGLKALILNPTFMIGPFDAKPSSGQMIIAVSEGKIPGYPGGGRNFVYVKDVAMAIVNAIELGVIGECYILGNENLYYNEIFSKMAKELNVKPPGIKFPGFITLAYGGLLTFLGRMFRFTPSVNYSMSLISTEFHFYSSAKAVRELKMPQTPIELAIKESADWFREKGYIKQ